MKTEANVEKRSLEDAHQLHIKLDEARLVLQSAADMFSTGKHNQTYQKALEQAARDFSQAYWNYDG